MNWPQCTDGVHGSTVWVRQKSATASGSYHCGFYFRLLVVLLYMVPSCRCQKFTIYLFSWREEHLVLLDHLAFTSWQCLWKFHHLRQFEIPKTFKNANTEKAPWLCIWFGDRKKEQLCSQEIPCPEKPWTSCYREQLSCPGTRVLINQVFTFCWRCPLQTHTIPQFNSLQKCN